VEFAPCSAAGRREGEDGEVKLNDGLLWTGLLEFSAGAGLSRPALSNLATNTIVSFIPSLLVGAAVEGRLEAHS